MCHKGYDQHLYLHATFSILKKLWRGKSPFPVVSEKSQTRKRPIQEGGYRIIMDSFLNSFFLALLLVFMFAATPAEAYFGAGSAFALVLGK